MPLGVLFHIAAGNAEALPAYSVAEGLLMGNVNLLKLPAAGTDGVIRCLAQRTPSSGTTVSAVCLCVRYAVQRFGYHEKAGIYG